MVQIQPWNGFFLWKYLPSLPAGAVFCALFTIATAAVIFRSAKTKTLYSIPFIIAGIFEAVGYAARAAAYTRTGQLVPFILQSVLILVAPALFAASIYMVMGRLVRSIHGERASLISPRWLTALFVVGDIFSFFVQVVGGSMLASKETTIKHPDLAKNVILVGLLIQIGFFGFFAITALVFHLRMRRNPTGAAMNPNSRWEQVLHMLYGVSILILIRSVIRVIEYVGGQDGYLLKHEWTLYAFDAVFMFVTMIIYAWKFPGRMERQEKEWDRPNADIHMAPQNIGSYQQNNGFAQNGYNAPAPAYGYPQNGYQQNGYPQR